MNVEKKLRKIAGELAEVAYNIKGFPTLNPPEPKESMGDYVRVYIQKDEQRYVKHFTTAKSVIARLIEDPSTWGSGEWEDIGWEDRDDGKRGKAYLAEFVAPTSADAKKADAGFWSGTAIWTGKSWMAIGNYGYAHEKTTRKWNPPKRVK